MFSQSRWLVIFAVLITSFVSLPVYGQGKSSSQFLCPNSVFPTGFIWDGNLNFTKNQCVDSDTQCEVVYFHESESYETAVCNNGIWQVAQVKDEPELCPNSVFPNGFMWNGDLVFTANQCRTEGLACTGVFFHEINAYQEGVCSNGIWDFDRGQPATLLAVNDNIAAEVGVTFSGNLLANDNLGLEPTVLSFNPADLPSWLTLDASGDYAGSAPSAADIMFPYIITDSSAVSSTAVVNIVASNPNIAVSAADDSYTLLAGESLNQNILDNDQIGNAPATIACLLYTSPSPRDLSTSRMPSSA